VPDKRQLILGQSQCCGDFLHSYPPTGAAERALPLCARNCLEGLTSLYYSNTQRLGPGALDAA
jgi:hypothetical protein